MNLHEVMLAKELAKSGAGAGTDGYSKEEIDGKFSAVESKNTEQDKKISALESADTSQDEQISALENSNKTQNSKISALESSDKTQNSKISAIESKNTELSGKIATIDNKIHEIKKKVIASVTTNARGIYVANDIVLVAGCSNVVDGISVTINHFLNKDDLNRTSLLFKNTATEEPLPTTEITNLTYYYIDPIADVSADEMPEDTEEIV